MRIGLIGLGNIATSLIDILPAELAEITVVMVRPGSKDRTLCKPGARHPVEIVETIEALLSACPDIVVECAGHRAVAENAASIPPAGITFVPVSVGALADDSLGRELKTVQASGGRTVLPICAIGDLDILSSLSLAGNLEVFYTGSKPPAARKGSPAGDMLDLDRVDRPAI